MKKLIAIVLIVIILVGGCKRANEGEEIKAGQIWEELNDNPFLETKRLEILDIQGDYVQYLVIDNNSGIKWSTTIQGFKFTSKLIIDPMPKDNGG